MKFNHEHNLTPIYGTSSSFQTPSLPPSLSLSPKRHSLPILKYPAMTNHTHIHVEKSLFSRPPTPLFSAHVMISRLFQARPVSRPHATIPQPGGPHAPHAQPRPPQYLPLPLCSVLPLFWRACLPRLPVPPTRASMLDLGTTTQRGHAGHLQDRGCSAEWGHDS